MNQGVHEPQKERVFAEVLKYIPQRATMIEFGSYWSFYSMWFQKEIKDAKNYMVESDPNNLEKGKRNFKLSDMHGDFTLGLVGHNGIKVDEFVATKHIETVHILHADIQGYELELLHGVQKTLQSGRVQFIFVSIHSQTLHYECLRLLKEHEFTIIASADFDYETFCYDGIIVAKYKGVSGPEPIALTVRDPQDVIFIHV